MCTWLRLCNRSAQRDACLHVALRPRRYRHGLAHEQVLHGEFTILSSTILSESNNLEFVKKTGLFLKLNVVVCVVICVVVVVVVVNYSW